MERTDSRYQAYMNILKEELIPAMAEDAMKSGNIPANPRQTNVKDIMELYRKTL